MEIGIGLIGGGEEQQKKQVKNFNGSELRAGGQVCWIEKNSLVYKGKQTYLNEKDFWLKYRVENFEQIELQFFVVGFFYCN